MDTRPVFSGIENSFFEQSDIPASPQAGIYDVEIDLTSKNELKVFYYIH
jgi:hypothetical protein